MSRFLKLEDLLIDFSDTGYEEAIVKFLRDNEITIDDFQHVGRIVIDTTKGYTEN